MPTNITPETATEITTSPFIATQEVETAPAGSGYPSNCDAAQRNAVWYKYTARENIRWLAFSANSSLVSANYDPTVSVWTGSPLAQYQIGSQDFCAEMLNDENRYFNIPVTPGATYYFQITNGNSNPSLGADLIVNFSEGPSATVPAGSLFIPDDTIGFPGVVLDATTGAVLASMPLPAGEIGDVLPTGELCVEDKSATTTVAVYGSDISLIATVALGAGYSPRGIHRGPSAFYVLKTNTVTVTLLTVSASGVIGGTSWSWADAVSPSAMFTPSLDGTILYYVREHDRTKIRRWDLVNNVALSDLAIFGAPWVGAGVDAFTGDDGSVFFAVLNTDAQIRRYSAAGTLLNTYAIPRTGAEGTFVALDHFAYDSASAFRMWGSAASNSGFGDDSRSLFRTIQISDGATLLTTPVVSTTGDSGGPTQLGTFAISNSCPLLVLAVGFTPPQPPPAPEPGPPPDPTAVLGTLVLDVKAKRWFFDEYASPVTTRLWESGEGVEVELLSHADGSLTQGGQSGNGDYGHEIPWLIQVPDFDGNDPRREKLFGDLFLSADPQGSTAGLTVTPGINGFSGVLTPTVIGSGESGRESFIVDINSGLGQRAKNLGLQTSGSDLVRPIVYLWEPSLVPKQVLSRLRATDWLDAGRPGAKWIQGLLVQADCDGATRQVQVEYDNGQLSEIFTITDAEESQIPYSFQHPFFAHLMRLRLVDLAEWQFFGAQWFFQPAPELVSTWQTPSTTLGFHGFGQLERILIAHVSTLDFTLDVVGDGIAQSYPVTNSAGIFRKDEVLLAPNKAKAYAFRASTDSGSAGLRLYVQDLEVRGKSYGSPEGYRVLRPFGAESVDPSSAARI